MKTHSLTVIGTGYVGLTTGACLASLGHRVVCADADAQKVERLRRAQVDILEPGLAQAVHDGLEFGRLAFVTDTRAAVRDAEVVFLCLPTPMGVGGGADLAAVEAVADEVRDHLPRGCTVVNKSTVPVGTAERIVALLRRPDVSVVSNPEFLREGHAVDDFLHPDRIVVGSVDADAAQRVSDLYLSIDAPRIVTDTASAELAKYAGNFFLAMKVSFANNLATLCERLGANIDDVVAGIGHDPRIGGAFLTPGPGWGGSCLPKDTRALLRVCEESGVEFPLLRAAIETNVEHQRLLVERVAAGCAGAGGSLRGVRLGLLGLTFKAGTSDLRDSPALAIARRLWELGANVHAYDPAISELPANLGYLLTLAGTPLDAVEGAQACIVLTEWPQFRDLDWEAVAERLDAPLVYDFRNLLDPARLAKADLIWEGLGRSPTTRR